MKGRQWRSPPYRNLQREDLNPIEIATVYEALYYRFWLYPGGICERIGIRPQFCSPNLTGHLSCLTGLSSILQKEIDPGTCKGLALPLRTRRNREDLWKG
jgi:hypothetical protein